MNIVLIVLDSLRQDHVGAYGNTWIKTPNLDRFATESVKFTRAYPEALPTLPVRRSLYTGRRIFPYSEMDQDWAVNYSFPGWGPIRADRMTVAEFLRKQNYRTSLVGDCYHMFKAGNNFHRGFDSWQFMRGQEMDNYHTGPALSDEFLESFIPESHKKNSGCKRFLGRYLMNTLHRDEDQTSCAMVFRKAESWLHDNLEAERFFMTLESFDPHEPWVPPAYYRRLYDEDGQVTDCALSPYMEWQGLLTERELKRLQANYAGSVTMVDRWFGHFMDALAYSGKLEDTVVGVISDHGHALAMGARDQDFVGKTGHPSTRAVNDLVLMIRHPDGSCAGQTCDKLCYNFDLTTTLLHMAGLTPPEEMEGINLWELASSDASGRDHTSTAWGTVVTVINDKWWYNANLWGEAPRLFDIQNDPEHRDNVAADHPAVCRELLDLAIQDAGGADKLPKSLASYKSRIGCGLNGYAPIAYSNATYIDVSAL